MSLIIATALDWGDWKLTGGGTTIDLIAASTNALNGAILARRPDHYKNFTIVGIVLMAIMGGIGGGVTRDVLLNKVPSALINPAYLVFCITAGVIGYFVAYAAGQLFREGLFQFMTAISLTWYAIIGAYDAIGAGIPVIGSLMIAVIAPTAGRWLIDVSSGVPPKQFVKGEWFVSTALLTGAVWIVADNWGLSIWVSTLVAFAVGFTFRMLALYRGWEEPLPKEPKGAYLHSDGRPLLGRKLHGKSQRELRDLGLLVEEEGSGSASE